MRTPLNPNSVCEGCTRRIDLVIFPSCHALHRAQRSVTDKDTAPVPPQAGDVRSICINFAHT